MTIELEKLIANKINKYKYNSNISNGMITDSVSSLINDLLHYILVHPIDSLKDIPEKFDPITKLT